MAEGTRVVRRTGKGAVRKVSGDICVVGSGAAGASAAIEAARLGRKVILIDGMPALAGQAVNSIIGTFCGLFSNGTHGYQFTHGIADDIMATLGKNPDQLYYRNGPHTTVVYYDEVALGRWIERTVRELGIQVIVGAVVREVDVDGRRIKKLHLATRYGDVEVEATGFVDASGDAALVYQAGFACREPDSPVYGTQMVILEHINEARMPTREAIPARMKEKGEKYGLVRREGLGFVIPGSGVAAMNMTHVETPLDPLEASIKGIDGKDQADRAVQFLREEFSDCFGKARIRAYGFPGIRQTRWIVGRQQLTVDDVRAGTKFPDAVARTAWPIELHDHSSGHHWHTFDIDHVHYVPLSSMIPAEGDNVVAAGRCIDADLPALSSVRVMGPCMAMGAAASKALDLAGTGSVHQIDMAALAKRVYDNVETKHMRWPGKAA